MVGRGSLYRLGSREEVDAVSQYAHASGLSSLKLRVLDARVLLHLKKIRSTNESAGGERGAYVDERDAFVEDAPGQSLQREENENIFQLIVVSQSQRWPTQQRRGGGWVYLIKQRPVIFGHV